MTQKEISNMSNRQIANLIDEFNRWRQGDCPFEEPGCNPTMEPNEISMILNEAVIRLKTKNKEIFNSEAFN